MNNEEVQKKSSTRNLVVLGVGSVLIAGLTSAASLYIYHASGDIYLDCSLPEADCPSARSDSEENKREDVYVFNENGKVDEKVLDEYLKEFNKTVTKIKKYEEPFAGDALTDESLGI